MSRVRSIRRFLLSGILALVSLSLAVSGLIGYLEANHEMEELFDARLAQSARITNQLLSRYLKQRGELPSFFRDALRPVRVLRAVGRCGRRKVDAHGVEHDVAEVATHGDVREVTADARTQLLDRHAAADRQAKVRTAARQFIQDRRDLRQMTEAVRGDVDEEV